MSNEETIALCDSISKKINANGCEDFLYTCRPGDIIYLNILDYGSPLMVITCRFIHFSGSRGTVTVLLDDNTIARYDLTKVLAVSAFLHDIQGLEGVQ